MYHPRKNYGLGNFRDYTTIYGFIDFLGEGTTLKLQLSYITSDD